MSFDDTFLANFVPGTYGSGAAILNITEVSALYRNSTGLTDAIEIVETGDYIFNLDVELNYRRTGNAFIEVYLNDEPLPGIDVLDYTTFSGRGNASLSLQLTLPIPTDASQPTAIPLTFQIFTPTGGSSVTIPSNATNSITILAQLIRSPGSTVTEHLRDLLRKLSKRASRKDRKIIRRIKHCIKQSSGSHTDYNY